MRILAQATRGDATLFCAAVARVEEIARAFPGDAVIQEQLDLARGYLTDPRA